MALSTDLERRIVDFTRKSDSKIFPAEVRQVPSRFEDITQAKITVGYIDAEDGFSQKSAVLDYADDTNHPWDWENDDWKCTYVLPEPVTVVAEQTSRGVSPISQKSHNMIVAK